MKHTECKDCELSNGDCGYHFKMDGKTNYDIASLSACDRYGNCEFFKSKAKPKGDLEQECIIEELENICINNEYVLDLLAKLRNKERPQGEWLHRRIITKDRSFDMVVCSNCQTEFSWDAETGVSMDNYKTCPNCGADMKGGAV